METHALFRSHFFSNFTLEHRLRLDCKPADEVHLTPLTRTMQMRASLHYLDEIDQLERTNARKERANNRIDGGSDDDLSPGQGGDSDMEESAKSASAIAARKQKRAAALDKKAKADDMKAINVSVAEGSVAAGGGSGGNAPKDAKTARAAASLFGPAKAALDEDWVDLHFYDPTVSRPSLTSLGRYTPS